ncbi:MAG: hypothetical protein IJH95_07610 [Mogibacterium sp.]|nr:hypothetical protein [Mogibacterium sp.]
MTEDKMKNGCWNWNNNSKALDDELLENVGGGADKIKGGRRPNVQNTLKIDDRIADNGGDDNDNLNIMV